MADVTDSKSVGLITRVGSSPTTGTIPVFQQSLENRSFSLYCFISKVYCFARSFTELPENAIRQVHMQHEMQREKCPGGFASGVSFTWPASRTRLQTARALKSGRPGCFRLRLCFVLRAGCQSLCSLFPCSLDQRFFLRCRFAVAQHHPVLPALRIRIRCSLRVPLTH